MLACKILDDEIAKLSSHAKIRIASGRSYSSVRSEWQDLLHAYIWRCYNTMLAVSSPPLPYILHPLASRHLVTKEQQQQHNNESRTEEGDEVITCSCENKNAFARAKQKKKLFI
jgi:hypothetical protein